MTVTQWVAGGIALALVVIIYAVLIMAARIALHAIPRKPHMADKLLLGAIKEPLGIEAKPDSATQTSTETKS